MSRNKYGVPGIPGILRYGVPGIPEFFQYNELMTPPSLAQQEDEHGYPLDNRPIPLLNISHHSEQESVDRSSNLSLQKIPGPDYSPAE